MRLTRVETLGARQARAYSGTFAPDAPEPAARSALPPGWEGLYFPFDLPLADLRADGSPARDGVLPEVDLPRRMYAGEDTVFHQPPRFGDEVEQTVSAGSFVAKTGRSGRLVFADLVREYRVGGALAIESVWHDVFLDPAPPGQPTRPPAPAPSHEADWTERHSFDARQLFRFSAITFNTHRVHYDRAWARESEGLDDLLVHGPLTRIILLDAARRHEPGESVASYSFRSHAPVLVDRPVTITGHRDSKTTELHALDADGGLLARGLVTWRTQP